MVRRLPYPEIPTLNGIEVIADDFLVTGSDNSDEQATMDHNANLETFLKQCENGVSLNRNKIQLPQPEVPFIGHAETAPGSPSGSSQSSCLLLRM